MKNLLSLFVALVAISISSLSAEERVIDQSELPKNALTFISTQYAADAISIATVERDLLDKDYKVILTSGVKVEFDSDGNWTEIECKRNSSVPDAVIPAKIATYLKNNYPTNKVLKIEKGKKKVDIDLDNNTELTFNSKGDLIEIEI